VAVAVEGNLRVVLDEEYRIVEVSPAAQPILGPLVGETVWDHFPDARAIFLPSCEEARRSRERVEFVAFYEGALVRVQWVPEGLRLAAIWEILGTVDVSTIDALRDSLRDIVSALAEEEGAGPLRKLRPALRVVEGGA
jgi:hypothetical protein